MLSKIYSAGLIGIDAYIVQVEVDLSPGLANWCTVGLPESSVRESRDRVIAAIRNSGYSFERRRITICLGPADIKKEGTAYDLPIAIGLLISSEKISPEPFSKTLLLGELSLEGEVKPVPGILSIALAAKKEGFQSLIVSHANRAEASLVKELTVYGVRCLADVVQHATGERPLGSVPSDTTLQSSPAEESAETPTFTLDFSEIKGQAQTKRALEVAAAGGHHILMIGPPGSGKTMLAQRLPTILPPMGFEEAIETTRIYSVTGGLNGSGPLLRDRPFRSPHHTISSAGLAGGGTHPRPGEVSLAHHGVLFLDELPEFPKNVIEVLRQPLEAGHVTIARALSTITYPARFMLVAAMNPCRCGHLGSPLRECLCSESSLHHYRARISGPLLDRLDIQIHVPPVRFGELMTQVESEPSHRIRERVLAARHIQEERFLGTRIRNNAQMSGRLLRKHCPIDEEGVRLMEKAVEKLCLSARAYDRILKVARTIADLEKSVPIKPEHLAEAIHYRSLDRRQSVN